MMTRLLREYIRELLIESVDGKIMSMIDRAEEAGYKVRLFSAANGGSVYLLPPEGWDSPASALGAVDWHRPRDYGPCMQAMNVTNSKASGGFGPLLYDVAIEASGGLMADRYTVSGEAADVWWNYMNRRSDVIQQQLDNNENQLTPDDGDNCDQNVSIGDAGRADWPESPLSKVYSKAGTPVIDELINRGMLVRV